jgi:hypothetical protein
MDARQITRTRIKDIMQYLLAPKRYGMNRSLNKGRWRNSQWTKEGGYTVYPSQREANLILSSELDVVKFLRSRIVEDVADCAERKQYNVFQFLMKRNNKTFRELIARNFELCKYTKECEWDWQEKHKVAELGSLPLNYKIYIMEQVDSHGVSVQKQTLTTWYKFFMKCKKMGIEQECVYKEL